MVQKSVFTLQLPASPQSNEAYASRVSDESNNFLTVNDTKWRMVFSKGIAGGFHTFFIMQRIGGYETIRTNQPVRSYTPCICALHARARKIQLARLCIF